MPRSLRTRHLSMPSPAVGVKSAIDRASKPGLIHSLSAKSCPHFPSGFLMIWRFRSTWRRATRKPVECCVFADRSGPMAEDHKDQRPWLADLLLGLLLVLAVLCLIAWFLQGRWSAGPSLESATRNDIRQLSYALEAFRARFGK